MRSFLGVSVSCVVSSIETRQGFTGRGRLIDDVLDGHLSPSSNAWAKEN